MSRSQPEPQPCRAESVSVRNPPERLQPPAAFGLVFPMALPALKLYSYFASSCSFRVRLVLAMKGAPYTVVPVDLRAGQQHSAEMRARNPFAQVIDPSRIQYILTFYQI